MTTQSIWEFAQASVGVAAVWWLSAGLAIGLFHLRKEWIAALVWACLVVLIDLRLRSHRAQALRNRKVKLPAPLWLRDQQLLMYVYGLKAMSGEGAAEARLCKAQECTEHLDASTFERSEVAVELGRFVATSFLAIASIAERRRFLREIRKLSRDRRDVPRIDANDSVASGGEK